MELFKCQQNHKNNLPADRLLQAAQLVENRTQQQWAGSKGTAVISCAEFVSPCVPGP